MQRNVCSGSFPIVFVVTGCGGGDWPPLLALAQGLQQAGHSIVVVCDTSTVKSVKAASLPPLCLPHWLDLGNVFTPALSRLLSGSEKLDSKSENPLRVWGHSCVDYILRSLCGLRPSLVVTSLFGLGLGEALAKHFSSFKCFVNPSFYFGYSGITFRYCDFSNMGGQMYKYWLLPLAQSADLVLHATDCIFDLSPDHIPDNHFYVGPMFWEEPGSLWDCLRKPGSPWVLVTLSTSPQSGDLTIVKTALKSLEKMDVRVLVTLSSDHDKSALGQVPDNVHITGYVPHSHILPDSILVISHAGHGIVMKAMHYGVPMVLVPWGRDQPGVALRAERLGIAVVVSRETCTVQALSQAIKIVLSNPEYEKRARQQSSRLRETTGVIEASRAIEQFLLNG